MSASREKKQRQTSNVRNAKKLTAAQKAAAAKRKTTQYTLIGVVVAVLVAALLFWDAGFIQRNTTALTIGSVEYSPADVNYYYNSIYQNTYLYAYYGLNSYDVSKAPDEQIYSTDDKTGEKTTWHEYFLDSAIDTLVSITASYEAALKAGYTVADVADDVKTEMTSLSESASKGGYSSVKQMLVSYYGKTMTKAAYEELITRYALASLYLEKYHDDLDITEEALNNYYKANAKDLDTFDYTYLYFKAATVSEKDADGNKLSDDAIKAAKKEAMEKAKAQANEVLEHLKNGDDVNEVIKNHGPSSSSVNNVAVGSSITSSIAEWLTKEGRTKGDMDVVEYTDYGYYVVIMNDRYVDETPSADVRHILISAEISEGAKTPTNAQMLAAKAKAEALLEEWKKGEATAESFAELAEKNSTDTGSNKNGGLYEQVFEGDFVTNFNEWMFGETKREVGETGIVENNGTNYYGYHIIYFEGYNEGDFAWKNTADEALRSEAVTAHQEELEKPLTITEGTGMKYVG